MVTESDRIGQNDGEPSLTARQVKFLPVLLASGTYAAACHAGKVSRNTLYEWLKDPAFKGELDRQRDELVAQGFGLLSQSVQKAVETLVGLLGWVGRPTEAAGGQRHPRSAREIPGA